MEPARKRASALSLARPAGAAANLPTSKDSSPSRGPARHVKAPVKLSASAAPTAAGKDASNVKKTIDLRIPPGVDSGTRLRVTGEGEPAPNGGAPGDLYVVLDVKEHPFFERRGADLYCTIPLSVTQAALGTELQVPGLSGEEKLKVPEGTQSGAVFRLKGKGLADPRGGGKGDLYYHVRVLTPTKLTREQRKLLEQLGSTLKVENKPAERNSTIFDKVKDIFG